MEWVRSQHKNATVDITEWDGSVHTVRTITSSYGDIDIVYCDGVRHTLSAQEFNALNPSTHQYGFLLGNVRHTSPFSHAAGCKCESTVDKWGQSRVNTTGPKWWWN